VKAAQLEPEYRAALLKFGIEIDNVGPEPFAEFIHAESKRWTPILKDSGITFE
jgi:tripartite-type tricarboxylate transporter receptor subunit TctC